MVVAVACRTRGTGADGLGSAEVKEVLSRGVVGAGVVVLLFPTFWGSGSSTRYGTVRGGLEVGGLGGVR